MATSDTNAPGVGSHDTSSDTEAPASTPIEGAGDPGKSEQKGAEDGKGKNDSQQPNWVTGAIGIVFWVLIIGGIWGRDIVGHTADVALEVSSMVPEEVSGLVLYEGKPVSDGRVHLEFRDVVEDEISATKVVPVDADGRFATDTRAYLLEDAWDLALSITANYTGVQTERGDDDEVENENELTGSETIRLNHTEPFGLHFQWIGWTAGLVLLGSLVFLCTGELTRLKAKMLFRVTYLITVLALVVPLVAVTLLARSDHFVTIMQRSPVGIVVGRSKSVTDTQWLVNIGGEATLTQPTEDSPGDGPVVAPYYYIEGGLAVPFYVVMLAILGAGINMTKNVPSLQRDHQIAALREDSASPILHLLSVVSQPLMLMRSQDRSLSDERIAVISAVRMGIIRQYMFLVSAPFLAIAVYYLLQIVSKEVEEPVLVLMAFATGLVSDTIVDGISAFAKSMIARLTTPAPEAHKDGGGNGAAPGTVPESTPQTMPQAPDPVATGVETAGDDAAPALGDETPPASEGPPPLHDG